MSGATCGTWYAGAVVAPDVVVLVDDGAMRGATAADAAEPGLAPALRALQGAFPASRVVLARATQPQSCPAASGSTPSLDETLAALAQAGKRDVLVLPTSSVDREAHSQIGEAVAGWRARGTFRRLTLAQAPAAGTTSGPAAPQDPDALVGRAELAWWGTNPQVHPGR